MMQKSPSGSIFPYYYKGGEIHAIKLGSFYDDEAAMLSMLKAEEDFVKKPNRHLRIWIDLYKTDITDNIIEKLSKSLYNIKENTVKLAVVGLSVKDIKIMKKHLKRTYSELLPIKYYEDPEEAKTWLISE
jgi:hypothetical protein